MSTPVLILGASARAAASSAARAGLAPTAVDLFADRDLIARFPALRVDRDAYPEALAGLAATSPPMPWIYTGALENHPDLIDRIAGARPLLGIGGQALRQVRDPRAWTEALRNAGLPALDVRGEGDAPPRGGDWLLKPTASAMGRGIRRWTIGEGPIPRGWFLQRFAGGVPMAACFVGDGRSVRLAGVTRQFLGRSEGGLRVAYRGSIGPVRLPPGATSVVHRIGETLARAFGLRGLFGVDFLGDGGIPRTLEINPRYTASVEVLEEGLGVDLLGEHVRAFGVVGEDEGSHPTLSPPARGRVGWGVGTALAAKVILLAAKPAVVPDAWPWSAPLDPRPTVADIPAAGTILRPGDPVLTVLARGEGTPRLGDDLRRWRRRIATWPSP